MATETTPAADAGTVAPAAETTTETEAPAAGEETVTETPADGEALAAEREAEEAGEQAEEGTAEDKTPADKPAAKAEFTEDQLRAAGIKYANRTMAAARRAQARVDSLQGEIARLTPRAQRADQLDRFVEAVRQDPRTLYLEFGYKSLQEYADAIAGVSDRPIGPTADDRVAALEQQIAESKVESAKREVFTALASEGDKYDLVTTDIGKRELWRAVEAYHAQHGIVPDEAVYYLANQIQRGLEKQFSATKRFSGRPAETKTGTPAPKTAVGARSSGKTLASSRTGSAVTTRTYSPDPEESRNEVLAEMRAHGEL